MKKRILLLIIIAYTTSLAYGQNEIEITRCGISEISSSEYSLNYLIENTFDTVSFSKFQVILPFEKYILQGTIENGLVNEKDFLFSQIDIDLNNDKDLMDSFKAKIINKKLTIDNKKISALTKTTANHQVLIPYNEAGIFNSNKIVPDGTSFTLRNFSLTPPEITIGLNGGDTLEFRKYNNSLLLIEVITSDENIVESLLIDGEKPFFGITNEKSITGGENSCRFAVAKNINISDHTAPGKIKIEKISKPFLLRITYHFSISENIILINQKIIKVN